MLRKRILPFIVANKFKVLLWICIVAYIVYFSVLTIFRIKALYASYFDLGIMHQTVYNTYRALVTGDLSRFLELTNPHGFEQVKRMAIHNDILLAFMVPFYFIYSGPETLLVIQAVVLGLGALAVWKITRFIGRSNKKYDGLAFLFSLAYLLYPAMERANKYEFHAVTLTTSLLLWMIYAVMKKRYVWTIVLLFLNLIAKEQIALTMVFFGAYLLLFKHPFGTKIKTKQDRRLAIAVITVSIVWFILSMKVIIPYFRNGEHFAIGYYASFFSNPIKAFFSAFTINNVWYLIFLFGPVALLSFLSPGILLISLPEFAINMFSNQWGMRSIIYHYTSVLQPFIFVSAIYGAFTVIIFLKKKKISPLILYGALFITTMLFSYFKGPLPYSRERDIHPFIHPQPELREALLWSKTLKDESLKISSTGQLSLYFTSRRYFYNFNANYPLADYIVIRLNEIYNYPEKDELIPVYETLQKDSSFSLIYKGNNFEVYKKHDFNSNPLLQ